VKKLVLAAVPDFQQSHLQIAWEFVFRTEFTYQGSVVTALLYATVMSQKKQNGIIAGGTK